MSLLRLRSLLACRLSGEKTKHVRAQNISCGGPDKPAPDRSRAIYAPRCIFLGSILQYFIRSAAMLLSGIYGLPEQ